MSLKAIPYRMPLNLPLAFGLLAAAAAFYASPSHAGQCPADQVATNAAQSMPNQPEGVTDEVISSIDLSSKGDAWKGNMFRLRKLVVQPGGVVPWHEHTVRPANILVIEGAITEYSNSCSVPIEHKAGEATAEFGQLSHWWKNNGPVPAVLYSADILPPATDDHGAM
ncbi:cupin [Mesorhizobium sp. L-8-10]|uniref:cupin domain-containing protein n=2 Tax=Mesorhizobium TaxID=68287 RepID=UPI001928A004|nr:cupin domain-containing protein [Mesorhizobium sp. L-8-10]BCH20872.1 cupin [Mesorhizobium sp. L-8-3]BCH28698.1 cupin [Mesorhizobium sp. L-8-10]